LNGEVVIPSSKSHTIRSVIIASLAEGKSVLENPLMSADTKAAIEGCKALGAKIEELDGKLIIEGFGSKPKKPEEPLNTSEIGTNKTPVSSESDELISENAQDPPNQIVLDMLNSGTSINLLTSVVALGDFQVILDGDDSLRTRPVQPLLNALNNLGASVLSQNNDGCPPIEVTGPMKGGKTEIDCRSSQYLSSLLISCPLVENDTEIIVLNLCEEPYVEMTLKYLNQQEINYEADGLRHFKIKGGQKYKPMEIIIPSDWSSAAFPLVAAAITKSNVLLKGLDLEDIQGDKQIIEYLRKMGADITIEEQGIRIKGKELVGCELDLNQTPDALPAVSILGCFAKGKTIIKNVAHARIKETDRIKVMAKELSKMGVDVLELHDGLQIMQSQLKGAKVQGHHDHRVVMALSLAGLIAEGKTEVTTAEAVSVTFPNYLEFMKSIGANMEEEKK